jgi:hypothetical protein
LRRVADLRARSLTRARIASQVVVRGDGDDAAMQRRISPAQGCFSPRLIFKRI